MDPTANQDDDQPATDRETFQLEMDSKCSDQWRVRTADNQYWSVIEPAGGIQATGTAQYENIILLTAWTYRVVGFGRGVGRHSDYRRRSLA